MQVGIQEKTLFLKTTNMFSSAVRIPATMELFLMLIALGVLYQHVSPAAGQPSLMEGHRRISAEDPIDEMAYQSTPTAPTV